MNLSDLVDCFNRQLLSVALSEANAQPLDSEVENNSGFWSTTVTTCGTRAACGPSGDSNGRA